MSVKQGFLVKEGGSIKTWKKRYFVMKNAALIYSKKADTGNLGFIELQKSGKIESCEYKDKKFAFMVETPKRIFYLVAPSEDERVSWVAALQDERDRIQEKGKYAPKPNQPASAKKPQKAVNAEDFDLLQVIGEGSFGKVYQVRKKDTAKIYAMKVLNKKTILERSEVEHTKTEKDLLQRLVHPFLVNLYFSFQSTDKIYFVMDFVNGGELYSHLQREKKFPEPRVRFYCAEICLGLEYLHSSGVLYRDLKPENLLLRDDGHICMTDFGISKQGLGENDRTTTFCGTPEYLAPEVLQNAPYGKGVDWWAFGTLMYEMLTGLPPFYSKDVQQMYQKILSAPLNISSTVSPEARSLLTQLLEKDPNKRLSDAKLIKAHPWFKPIDFKLLVEKEITPPYIPPVKSKDDMAMIADEFKRQTVRLPGDNAGPAISDKDQSNFSDFTFVAPSALSN
jgi:RAC serine/threonine-protein kinase